MADNGDFQIKSNNWKYCAPQNDNDTEWHDILVSKGIIESEFDAEKLTGLVDETVHDKLNEKKAKDMSDMNLDELAALEDDVDSDEERFMEEYRQKRLAEFKEAAAKAKFGHVIEISKADWKREVNEAGKEIYVVVVIIRQGLVKSKMVEQCLQQLAAKFPFIKFVKGEADACIPNYPDANVPTILVYKDDNLIKQWVGFESLGGSKVSALSLEWQLSKENILETDLETDPRITKPVESAQLSSDEDDW